MPFNRGKPCTFDLIYPFHSVVTAGEGFELLLPISINTIPTLLAATHAFSKVSTLWKQYLFTNFWLQSISQPIQYYIISDTSYTRCSMTECCYIATKIMHIVLCAFEHVIPSHPAPILRPKILLYQLFQVFLVYKVPIQGLTLQPNSFIVSQQH